MAQIMRERCHGQTLRHGQNTRCRHTSLRSPYCWQHLKTLEGMRIKKSGVAAKAGMGLFTLKEIPAKKPVTQYTGDAVYSTDPDYGGPYVLQTKKHHFIDAKKTNEKGLGRWCNDNKGKRNNAELIYNSRTKKAYVKSKTKIKAGSEVTTAYGAEYWKWWGKKGAAKKPKKMVAKRSS